MGLIKNIPFIKDAFNYFKIISGKCHVIPENTEMILTEDLELIGDLEIKGVLTLL